MNDVAEHVLASLQIILASFAMGMRLGIADFRAVGARPRPLLLGLGVQLLLVPLLGLAVSQGFGLAPGLTLGMMLVATVPGGSLANMLVFYASASVPLCISLVTIENVAALMVTPTLLELTTADVLSGPVQMPVGHLCVEIVANLVLPLAAGMVLRAWRPQWSAALSRWAMRGALLALALFTASALAAGRVDMRAYDWRAPLAVVVLCVVLYIVPSAIARVARLAVAERLALAMHTTVRSTNLSVLLALSLFERGGLPAGVAAADVLFVALVYGGVSVALAGGVACHARWRSKQPVTASPT